jgi:nucleoside-diphosphate-sugar epimerase
MRARQNILIVGFGDIGKRVSQLLPKQHRVSVLVRNPLAADQAKKRRVTPIRGDLSRRWRLRGLYGRFDRVFHFAPPPATGTSDAHTRHLLDALLPVYPRRGMLTRGMPSRLVYISTTGVYGNRDGGWVDERTRTRPGTPRARRRVDAERALARWGRRHGVAVSILRAPGIYASDRLPIERLRKGTPALAAGEDVFTNHIHADDLARACVAAMQVADATQVYNVVDDSAMLMGTYFDLVADAFALQRPQRVSFEEARARLPPAMLSFMGESRRIGNRRLKQRLGFRLDYPTVRTFLDTVRRD